MFRTGRIRFHVNSNFALLHYISSSESIRAVDGIRAVLLPYSLSESATNSATDRASRQAAVIYRSVFNDKHISEEVARSISS